MKQPFDWTGRIEHDLDWIHDLVKHDVGLLKNANYVKIREILQKLQQDVEAGTVNRLEREKSRGI